MSDHEVVDRVAIYLADCARLGTMWRLFRPVAQRLVDAVDAVEAE